MNKRSLNNTEILILESLIDDFKEKNLETSSLEESYEGPLLAEMKQKICNDNEITTIDYDLALEHLEEMEYIKTGPKEFKTFDEYLSKGIFIMPRYVSKRKFSYLTKSGYLIFQQQSIMKIKKRKPNYNQININGGTFNNTQMSAGNDINQIINLNNDEELFEKLSNILKEDKQELSPEEIQELKNIIYEAKQGNAGNAKKRFDALFSNVKEVAKKIAWTTINSLISKYINEI
ncbi:hypothetical protein C6H65_00885 [Photorhabdus luminescens]|nr:hypothetical protein C6H65_00885 [Photorhabdus luminescens]